ncbi:MAG: DNA/RNA non-specific endonuclease [Bacteroidaceae bacterium]|nr:DNA/RNA non-specific endonuclease [Bacteroidaceae bacterium]
MKKFYFYPILLCATICLVACSKEENGSPNPGSNEDRLVSLIGMEAKAYQQRLEVPAVKDQSMFIVHSTTKYGVTYTEEWDKLQKTQRWAAYAITDLNAISNWNRNNWNNGDKGTIWKGAYYDSDPFQEDSVIPAQYRTRLSDYYGSGFTRGHIVNSQDRLMSQNANGQTFYLSNMQPQLYNFNSGIWLNMENWVHNLGFNKSRRKTLFIAKGGTTTPTESISNPLLTAQEINKLTNRSISIPVPRYFWMAILRLDNNDQYHAIAFWAEHKSNTANNIKDYTISIDELEARTGIDFFPNLPDDVEASVEATRNLSEWNW